MHFTIRNKEDTNGKINFNMHQDNPRPLVKIDTSTKKKKIQLKIIKIEQGVQTDENEFAISKSDINTDPVGFSETN